MTFFRFSALFAASVGLAAASSAIARPALVSSAPAMAATAANVKSVTLTFSEGLAPAQSGLEIIMTGMPGMASHAPMAITGFTAQMGKDRKSMTLLLRRPLSAGTYQVNWTAAGMDTHRMNGTFTFTVR